MDIGSGNQDMGSGHTIDWVGIDLHVLIKIRNAGRFRFKRLDTHLQRRNVGLRGSQRSLQRRVGYCYLAVGYCQLADLDLEGSNLCLQCREETSDTVWILNQTVPTLVTSSIAIPSESERGGGKGHQEGTYQKPHHYSPTKHGDPVGCSPGMNVIIRRVHPSVRCSPFAEA